MFCWYKKKVRKVPINHSQSDNKNHHLIKSSSSKFLLLDNKSDVYEDDYYWSDLKSLWGKDCLLGHEKDGKVTKLDLGNNEETNSLIELHSDTLLSFTSSDTNNNDPGDEDDLPNFYFQNGSSSTNTSDTGVCSDSDSPITSTSPTPPPGGITPDIIHVDILENSRAVTSLQEIQSLRAELLQEHERAVEEIKLLKNEHDAELKALHEVHDAFIESQRDHFHFQLKEGERRLQEVHSDWVREREHGREEKEAIRQAHALEIQSVSEIHQIELLSLRQTHKTELEGLKLNYESDLKQIKSTFHSHKLEHEQGREFELNEVNTKHAEELENLESHYKLEIELLQQKLKTFPHTPSGSKEKVTDLLNKEITSLTVVVELRNNEIRDLRQEVMALRLQLEKLHGVDDQNRMMIRRVEDLEAQLDKTRDDKKKLIVENQSMQSSMHETLSSNTKLLMEIDFLRFRFENNETEEPSNHIQDEI